MRSQINDIVFQTLPTKVAASVSKLFSRPVSKHIIYCLFSACLVFLMYGQTLSMGFVHDDYIYLVASNIPNADTLEYWVSVFTHPNAFGVQYRPLGFFGFFYIMRELFDLNPVLYRWVSLLSLTIIVTLLMKFFEVHLRNRWAVFLATIMSVFHYGLIHSTFAISCIGKYFFSAILLLLGLLYIAKKDQIWIQLGFLVLICCLSIMLNEATLGFGFVFFGYLWLHKKRADWRHIILLVPSFLFFIVRTFWWGLPSKHFMKVDPSLMPKSFFSLHAFSIQPFFMSWIENVVWLRPTWISAFIGAILILAILWYSVAKLNAQKRGFVLWVIAATSFTFMPFTPLVNHQGEAAVKGVVWSLLLYSGLLVVIYEDMWSKKMKFIYRRWILGLIAIVCITSLFYFHQALFSAYFKFFNHKVTEPQNKVVNSIESSLKNIPSRTDSCDNCYRLTGPGLSGRWYHEASSYFTRLLIPGLLAVHFPQQKFWIPSIDGTMASLYLFEMAGNSAHYGTVVENGYYYQVARTKDNKLIAIDPFGYSWPIKWADIKALKKAPALQLPSI